MLPYGIPPEFRCGVHLLFKPPYAIRSVPSLSGHHASAYRWRSLPGVHRHRASKPQGSSERVLPWQVTMDQLKCTYISHTHYYWYEVVIDYRMLKVLPGTVHQNEGESNRRTDFWWSNHLLFDTVLQSMVLNSGI